MGPQQAQVGQQRARATPKKGYRIPEVKRAAAAAADSLRQDFGEAEWIDQAVDGLEVYLQRCIESFSGTPTPQNAGPITHGSDYREFARSAQEIRETMAAEEGSTSRAPQRVPRYRQRPDEVEIPEGELADPVEQPAPPPPPKKAGNEWLL